MVKNLATPKAPVQANCYVYKNYFSNGYFAGVSQPFATFCQEIKNYSKLPTEKEVRESFPSYNLIEIHYENV